MRSVADLTVSLAAGTEAAPDVRTLALVGSHARGTARADSTHPYRADSYGRSVANR